jgi:hypothetical protein
MQPGKPQPDQIHWPFVIAWLFALMFYFLQYGLRSAPSVMVSDLTTAYGLTAMGISSLIGVYYYTYSSGVDGAFHSDCRALRRLYCIPCP